MIRYGASAQEMQPIPTRELFILHLKLLIIMTKACMKGNPLGAYRKRAIAQTARSVFSKSRAQANRLKNATTCKTPSRESRNQKIYADLLFLQQTQLLAVMAHALANGKANGRLRKRAMVENINLICGHLSRCQTPADTIILKVA